jgi:hypothetical protein
MNAPSTLAAAALTAATLSLLAGCASSGASSGTPEPQTAVAPSGTAAQAGTAARRSNPAVLTAAEIATISGVTNALEAVEKLRPHFLRPRGGPSRPAGMLGAGAEGAISGRRPGEVQGAQPGSPSGGERGETSSSTGGRQAPEDPGILVYIDRQRYGRVQTLREIPIATVEEIRFLSASEANSLLGMGHPHGVIQVISKRGGGSQ